MADRTEGSAEVFWRHYPLNQLIGIDVAHMLFKFIQPSFCFVSRSPVVQQLSTDCSPSVRLWLPCWCEVCVHVSRSGKTCIPTSPLPSLLSLPFLWLNQPSFIKMLCGTWKIKKCFLCIQCEQTVQHRWKKTAELSVTTFWFIAFPH